MKKNIKVNTIENNLNNKYLIDIETWEIENIKYKYKKQIISIKKKSFMKIFDNKNLKFKLYNNLGDYIKYIYLITDYIDYSNTINFVLFQKDYNINDPLLSKIRKRFSNYNIIVKDNKIWYLNPIIAIKGTEIELELWELFKDKNLKLYWITNL